MLENRLKQLAIAEDRSEYYDLLVKKSNPLFNEIVRATNIVRDFIIKRKLIVYGGTAIDYLLRLKNGKIYPDELLEIADLDFNSPNHVEDAYDLCDILFAAGFTNVRCIVGQHQQTMKVDIEDNNWIADIAYCPLEIFKKIPWVDYEGIRVVHPNIQKIDIHSSLMMPYTNSPREVIFHRWSKDIKRLNKLEEYYPFDKSSKKTSEISKIQKLPKYRLYVPAKLMTTMIAYGYFAYACLSKWFNIKYKGVPSLNLSETEKGYEFDSYLPMAELLSADLDSDIGDFDISGDKYNAQREYIFPRLEDIDKKLVIYDSSRYLISYDSVNISTSSLRFINVQGLMKYFLAMSFLDEKNRDIHMEFYINCRRMIDIFEKEDDGNKANNTNNEDKLSLSIRTYGFKNSSDFVEVLISDMDKKFGLAEKISIPNYYQPSKIERPKKFDYSSSQLFNYDGSKIKISDYNIINV